MKGFILSEFNKPYQFSTDIPKPELEKDTDVLIKVAVAGYCHSDSTVQQGDFEAKMKSAGRALPLIPSHEGVGIVSAVGSNVKHIKVRDNDLRYKVAYFSR